jgi:hypothetical protein
MNCHKKATRRLLYPDEDDELVFELCNECFDFFSFAKRGWKKNRGFFYMGTHLPLNSYCPPGQSTGWITDVVGVTCCCCGCPCCDICCCCCAFAMETSPSSSIGKTATRRSIAIVFVCIIFFIYICTTFYNIMAQTSANICNM